MMTSDVGDASVAAVNGSAKFEAPPWSSAVAPATAAVTSRACGVSRGEFMTGADVKSDCQLSGLAGHSRACASSVMSSAFSGNASNLNQFFGDAGFTPAHSQFSAYNRPVPAPIPTFENSGLHRNDPWMLSDARSSDFDSRGLFTENPGASVPAAASSGAC